MITDLESKTFEAEMMVLEIERYVIFSHVQFPNAPIPMPKTKEYEILERVCRMLLDQAKTLDELAPTDGTSVIRMLGSA